MTLEGDLEGTDELVDEIREHVAKRIGKLARPKRIIWADDLPKTRSGKIMRRLLRDIAEGRELGDVTTLRDPDVMAQLEEQDQGAPGRGGLVHVALSVRRLVGDREGETTVSMSHYEEAVAAHAGTFRSATTSPPTCATSTRATSSR